MASQIGLLARRGAGLPIIDMSDSRGDSLWFNREALIASIRELGYNGTDCYWRKRLLAALGRANKISAKLRTTFRGEACNDYTD